MMDAFAPLVVAAAVHCIVRGTEVGLAVPAGGAVHSVGNSGANVFHVARRTALPALSSALLIVIILGLFG